MALAGGHPLAGAGVPDVGQAVAARARQALAVGQTTRLPTRFGVGEVAERLPARQVHDLDLGTAADGQPLPRRVEADAGGVARGRQILDPPGRLEVIQADRAIREACRDETAVRAEIQISFIPSATRWQRHDAGGPVEAPDLVRHAVNGIAPGRQKLAIGAEP